MIHLGTWTARSARCPAILPDSIPKVESREWPELTSQYGHAAATVYRRLHHGLKRATYDLENDALEKINLKMKAPEVFKRLRAEARALTDADWVLRDRDASKTRPKLTKDEKEHLRALGYLE